MRSILATPYAQFEVDRVERAVAFAGEQGHTVACLVDNISSIIDSISLAGMRLANHTFDETRSPCFRVFIPAPLHRFPPPQSLLSRSIHRHTPRSPFSTTPSHRKAREREGGRERALFDERLKG